MKAIVVKHPWCQWIVNGSKTIFTSLHRTTHRGDLLICSAPNLDLASAVETEETRSWEYGKALAVVQIVDCRKMTSDDTIHALTCPSKGRYSWVLNRLERILAPFPIGNKLGRCEIAIPEGMEREF